MRYVIVPWLLLSACSTSNAIDGGADANLALDAASFDVVTDVVGSDAADASGDVASDTGPEAGLLTLLTMSGNNFGVDAQYVYGIKAPNIVRCKKTGCNDNPDILVSNDSYNSIAIDSANMYWTSGNKNSVLRCAVTGCNGTPTTIAAGQFNLGALAIDATDVYFVASGAIKRCPLSGACPNPTVVFVSNASAIAVDSQDVFIADNTTSTIKKCSKSGCGNPTTLAMSPSVFNIVVDATDVYWPSVGKIMKCAKGGCNSSPTAVANIGNPTKLAIDSNMVYWSNFPLPDAGAGTIEKCVASSCAPMTVTTVPNNGWPTEIGVDAFSVYWIDQKAMTLNKFTPK